MDLKVNNLIISDDKNRINIHVVHQYLSIESYWAQNIPFETVKKSIGNSLCFGLYKDEKQ